MQYPIVIEKREGPLDNESGDFIFGYKYVYLLEQKDLDENQILLLVHFAYFTPNALITLGFSPVSVETFLDDGVYTCPFRRKKEQEFFGMYPLAILSKDISKYRVGNLKNNAYDMAFDNDWTKGMSAIDYDKDGNKLVKIPVDNIAEVYLGHGYTEGNIPYDGSGSRKQVKVKLSNGDWLVCLTWEWYNK